MSADESSAGKNATGSNIDNLLKEFRRELDAIKSRDFAGTKLKRNNETSAQLPQRPQKKTQQTESYDLKTVNDSAVSDAKYTTERETKKEELQSFEALSQPSPIRRRAPLSPNTRITWSDSPQETTRSKLTDDESTEIRSYQKLSDFIGSLTNDTSPLSNGDRRPPIPTSNAQQIVRNELKTTDTNNHHSIEDSNALRLENMKLQSEVSRLTSTVATLSDRVHSLEGSVDKVMQLLSQHFNNKSPSMPLSSHTVESTYQIQNHYLDQPTPIRRSLSESAFDHSLPPPSREAPSITSVARESDAYSSERVWNPSRRSSTPDSLRSYTSASKTRLDNPASFTSGLHRHITSRITDSSAVFGSESKRRPIIPATVPTSAISFMARK